MISCWQNTQIPSKLNKLICFWWVCWRSTGSRIPSNWVDQYRKKAPNILARIKMHMLRLMWMSSWFSATDCPTQFEFFLCGANGTVGISLNRVVTAVITVNINGFDADRWMKCCNLDFEFSYQKDLNFTETLFFNKKQKLYIIDYTDVKNNSWCIISTWRFVTTIEFNINYFQCSWLLPFFLFKTNLG